VSGVVKCWLGVLTWQEVVAGILGSRRLCSRLEKGENSVLGVMK